MRYSVYVVSLQLKGFLTALGIFRFFFIIGLLPIVHTQIHINLDWSDVKKTQKSASTEEIGSQQAERFYDITPRLRAEGLWSLCRRGQSYVQLGTCSSHFIECARHGSGFAVRSCPFRSYVFMRGKCLPAQKFPLCREYSSNTLNEETQDLIKTESFCANGAGIYRGDNGQQDDACSRQAFICHPNGRDVISISCAVGQSVTDNLECVPAPKWCPSELHITAPIRQFFLQRTCHASLRRRFPKIKSEREHKRAQYQPETPCKTCGHEWESVSLEKCGRQFIYCEGSVATLYTCEEGMVFNGDCTRREEVDGCGVCEKGQRRRANSCHEYYECDHSTKSGLMWQLRKCPDGEALNYAINICQKNYTCAKRTTRIVHQYPSTCDRFTECLHGKWVDLKCPAGYIYDVKTMSCSPGGCRERREFTQVLSPPTALEEPFSTAQRQQHFQALPAFFPVPPQDDFENEPAPPPVPPRRHFQVVPANVPAQPQDDFDSEPAPPPATPRRHYQTVPAYPTAPPQDDFENEPAPPPATPRRHYQTVPAYPTAPPQDDFENEPAPPPATPRRHYQTVLAYPTAPPQDDFENEPAPPPVPPRRHFQVVPAYLPAQPQDDFDSEPAPPPATPRRHYQTVPAYPTAPPQDDFENEPAPPPVPPRRHFQVVPAYLPAQPQDDFDSEPALPPAPPRRHFRMVPASPPAPPQDDFDNEPTLPPAPPLRHLQTVPASPPSPHQDHFETLSALPPAPPPLDGVPHFVAPSCVGNISLADEYDCARYWECRSSGRFQSRACPIGYIYDIYKKHCVPGTCYRGRWINARCGHGKRFFNGKCTDEDCAKSDLQDQYYSAIQCRSGAVRPHPSNQKLYIFCYYGVWTERACLEKEAVFDFKILGCTSVYHAAPIEDYKPRCYEGNTKALPRYCSLYEESSRVNGYRRVPHDCSKYYQCVHGKWVERPCAPGTVFNERISVCDHAANVPECGGIHYVAST
ncbi:unnamed protein product [Angiostrongylus costaricensis]|uniref:Chitin-binding type-2 domain-containing protein n=1 Tax=Angiostrongylus costaricensis TaxID=334426 RepID=A0A0R3PVY0_ANGCS|nr:unnamed protein product [Angiostrongylus costaricensis]